MFRPAFRVALFAGALSMALSAQAPSGWKVHTDPSQSASDPDNTPNLQFMAMGNGFHVVAPTVRLPTSLKCGSPATPCRT